MHRHGYRNAELIQQNVYQLDKPRNCNNFMNILMENNFKLRQNENHTFHEESLEKKDYLMIKIETKLHVFESNIFFLLYGGFIMSRFFYNL